MGFVRQLLPFLCLIFTKDPINSHVKKLLSRGTLLWDSQTQTGRDDWCFQFLMTHFLWESFLSLNFDVSCNFLPLKRLQMLDSPLLMIPNNNMLILSAFWQGIGENANFSTWKNPQLPNFLRNPGQSLCARAAFRTCQAHPLLLNTYAPRSTHLMIVFNSCVTWTAGPVMPLISPEITSVIIQFDLTPLGHDVMYCKVVLRTTWYYPIWGLGHSCSIISRHIQTLRHTLSLSLSLYFDNVTHFNSVSSKGKHRTFW